MFVCVDIYLIYLICVIGVTIGYDSHTNEKNLWYSKIKKKITEKLERKLSSPVILVHQ